MTFVASYRHTIAGARRIAMERVPAIGADRRAVQPEPAPVAVPVAEPAPEPENVVPLVPSEARQMMRKHLMPHWAQSIVMAVAELHRLEPEDIIRRSRRAVITAARNEAWYRIKMTASPVTGERPSYPTIGKWFGRDHSSVIYGVARHAFENGLPSPTGMDPEKLISRKSARSLKSYYEQRGKR